MALYALCRAVLARARVGGLAARRAAALAAAAAWAVHPVHVEVVAWASRVSSASPNPLSPNV